MDSGTGAHSGARSNEAAKPGAADGTPMLPSPALLHSPKPAPSMPLSLENNLQSLSLQGNARYDCCKPVGLMHAAAASMGAPMCASNQHAWLADSSASKANGQNRHWWQDSLPMLEGY